MASRHSPWIVLLAVGLVWQAQSLLAFAQDDLADIVERSEQAVVKIEVQGRGGESLGSGFVVDPNGTIVTNVHVLAGAQKAIATFPNGNKAEIRGTMVIDQARDVCIAKIDGTNLPVLPIAAEPPRKGERVTALGSPHGLSFSATTGIVSAIRPAKELGPEIGRPEIQGTWIQVDAALSGGNSGGPLINNSGHVVGMSTLASQGAAQNLNFGISGADIQQLYQHSKNQPLVSLADGVGKLESPEPSSPESGDREPIPEDSLARYVQEGRSSFEDLLIGVRQELSRNTSVLREMRRGDTFLPPNSPPAAEVVRVINTRSKKTNYFFRNQGVKDREVNRLQKRVRELQTIEKSATDASNKESLYALLSQYGPRLDAQRKGSIGFLFDAVVLYAFNEHGVIILYDNTPYLLWVESTAGLSEGVELSPSAVYVAGTETIEIPNEAPRVLTVLYSVTEDEMRKAVFGSSKLASEEWRTWKDSTGKFQIEATLVEVNEREVVLKKRDGSTVKVPIFRLSTEDRERLGKKN